MVSVFISLSAVDNRHVVRFPFLSDISIYFFIFAIQIFIAYLHKHDVLSLAFAPWPNAEFTCMDLTTNGESTLAQLSKRIIIRLNSELATPIQGSQNAIFFLSDDTQEVYITCMPFQKGYILAQVPKIKKDDSPCCSSPPFLAPLHPPATLWILMAVLFNLQGGNHRCKPEQPTHPSRPHLDRPILSVRLVRKILPKISPDQKPKVSTVKIKMV